MKVVDLFCGAGGLSEGFRQAGFSIAAGADSDPDAMATFAQNFPEAEAITGNLSEPLVQERVLSHAHRAFVVVGGPPCQAFSQVRNHSRVIDDPRNSLYREFVSILKKTIPPVFAMENVTGIEQMGVHNQIREDLSIDGEYKVSYQIVDAADFGVPQTRKRVIFIGVHHSMRIENSFLTGSNVTSLLSMSRQIKNDRVIYRVLHNNDTFGVQAYQDLNNPESLLAVTVSDAISDLSNLPVGNRNDSMDYRELPGPSSAYQKMMRQGCAQQISNVQVPRINSDTVLRLRAIPQGGNYRDLEGELLNRYLTDHRWGQSNGSGKLSRRHFYAYRRLHPSIWAWTLNTKADSVYHYNAYRALSVREFARIQSFPDRFVFTTDPRSGQLEGRHPGGPAHSRYRQAGNAVPPLLAKRLALMLVQELNARSDLRADNFGTGEPHGGLAARWAAAR
ncbi:DNA cytosine methyltransferase [Rhodospira trueperi]|nr:DNA cytosine methyltransferase [Rhodospira trueperi]